jgi:hypothetical protein
MAMVRCSILLIYLNFLLNVDMVRLIYGPLPIPICYTLSVLFNLGVLLIFNAQLQILGIKEQVGKDHYWPVEA